jgi:hypothetical protein
MDKTIFEEILDELIAIRKLLVIQESDRQARLAGSRSIYATKNSAKLSSIVDNVRELK